jgi:hypothetical protein
VGASAGKESKFGGGSTERLWDRLCRAATYILGISLGAVSHGSEAATYWQLSESGVTVVVEGDEETAKAAATITLRLQSAARWLLSWPDGYREPPVLALVVDERLLRRFFRFSPEPPGAYADANTGHESWERTASLTVVVVPKVYERGREYRSLQHAYGRALLDGGPAHDWPACLQDGMSVVFAAAELTSPNHFYFPGNKVPGRLGVANPDEFLVPKTEAPAPMPQWVADRRGYSCYLMSFMIASTTAEQRLAMEKMLTAVGRGTVLSSATTSELHQTLPEFTASYHDFLHGLQAFPNRYDLRVDFPQTIPTMPKPEPITVDRVQALMGQLCSKLQNCRK